MTVTEIVIFDTNDEFRNNLGLLLPGLDIALKADGALGVSYYGIQIEDGSTGYVLLPWDSFEAHNAFMDGPAYPTLLEVLKPCGSAGGKLDMLHVAFSHPFTLDEPVTEVSILTLKAPEHRATVINILSKMSDAGEGMVVFGQTREDEHKFVVLSGWPTVEAHREMVSRPEAAATPDELFSLVNHDHLYHAKLSAHRVS